MSRCIRVGIVGGGGIAKAHVIALRSLRSYFGEDGVEAEVVAVADVDGSAAQRAARAYGVGHWSTDWREMVRDDAVEAVTIATPNDQHEEVALAAAEAGKAVLSEKPLAHDVDSARRMVRAVESAGVVHSVNLNYRTIPAIQYAKQLIDEGHLGEIVSFRGAFLQDWAADPTVPRSWKFERRRAGAGPLLSVGCHVIDLARVLVGEVSEVVATTRTAIAERPLPIGHDTYASAGSQPAEMAPVDIEDVGTVLMRFDSGATGAIETSRVAPGRKNHCVVEISGTEGALSFDYERLNELHVATAQHSGRVFSRVVIGPEHDGGLVWTLGGLGVGFAETIILHMRGFADAITRGSAASPTFVDGLRAQEVVDAALRSAAAGTWHDVAYAAV